MTYSPIFKKYQVTAKFPIFVKKPPCSGVNGSPKMVCPPDTCECDLIWEKVFADAIKGLKMRSLWIRVDPKSNDKNP